MSGNHRHMASDQTLNNDTPHERAAIRMRREAEALFEGVLHRRNWIARDRDALAEALENIVSRELSARGYTEGKQR